jgi:hypothetical protein
LPHWRTAPTNTNTTSSPAAAIAEARSRALALQPGARLLGSTGVQRCVVVLRTMAVAVVSDPQLFAHERELALEALFWFNARWGCGSPTWRPCWRCCWMCNF